MSELRVSVDATPLLLQSAGVKNYLYFWIEALRRVVGEEAVRAFPYVGRLRGLDHERSMLEAWETYPRLAVLFGVRFFGSAVLEPALWGIDLFHTTNQVRTAPRRAKVTGTIHDLTCWLMPELHTEANVRADREFAERVWKRADGLIAVSENTRRDAIERLGLPEGKVRTIHSGVAERFFQVSEAEIAMARREAGLNKPYVLCLGTIEPRKNIDRLLDGWEALPADVRAEYDLVVAGPEGWRSERTMGRLRGGGVRYIGYVPELWLGGLTAGAAAFAYPSLYEGFGFPVVQAMAAGVPVLTSNTSCLPEVAGAGAVYADPLSVGEIRDQLLRLLTEPGLRDGLSARGRERAEGYRWERCAAESWRFFEGVAGAV